MNFKIISTLAAMLSAPFGLGFLFAPGLSASMYGMVPDDAFTLLIIRYFGSGWMMFAAAAWGLRTLTDPVEQRAAASVIALGTLTGLAVTLHGLMAGSLNSLGWTSMALYAFFVVAWSTLALRSVRTTSHLVR
jgi:hypothetical protein